MKKIITLFAFCFFFCGQAQDYRLFPKGQKAFFIDTTLGAGLVPDVHYLFDPVATFQSENEEHDSVFALTAMQSFSPFDNYVLLNNGDQKLKTNIGTFTVLKNALPGDSWLGLENTQHELENITYESKTLESVFGIEDSVKTYSLTESRVLKISKKYGLMLLPVAVHSFDIGYSQLRLFSINSLQPQYNIRDYRNVFHFNKGYVYGSSMLNDKYKLIRMEILEKIVRIDSTIYEIALWDKQEEVHSNCQPNCNPVFDRDTFTLVVKEQDLIGYPKWMSPREYSLSGFFSFVNWSDLAGVKFVENDTLFSVGSFNTFESSTTYLRTSRSKGFIESHYEMNTQFPLPLLHFNTFCYYMVNAPEVGCEAIEDLTPTFESISKESQIAIFYNSESREINLSSEEISGAKISLVDTQGRTVYSTYPQSNEVKIPCANTNGFNQLLIESENRNYRRGVVVY